MEVLAVERHKRIVHEFKIDREELEKIIITHVGEGVEFHLKKN